MFSWSDFRRKNWWGQVFFLRCTRTFSPQFREKTQMICLVILVLFVPSIAMLKSLNRHLSFLFFFFFLFLVISFFVGLFISLNYFLVYFLVDTVSCLRIFPLVFLFLLCLFSINLSAIFFLGQAHLPFNTLLFSPFFKWMKDTCK